MDRRANAFFVISAFAVLLGCNGPQTPEAPAVDIELVQDPAISTSAEVLANLAALRLIVDSPQGLYAPGQQQSHGNITVANADDDEMLELVIRLPLKEGSLPTIRLEQGGLPDVPLDLHVVGTKGESADSQIVAEGLARGVSLERPPGVLMIPFNLRPELLPPRVVDVFPRNGDEITGCEIEDIVLLFSKPVSEQSLGAPGAVSLTPTGTVLEMRHDASGLIAHLKVAGLVGDGGTLAYRLGVTSVITDLDGLALDQVPAEEGAQGFEQAFSVRCSPPPQSPDTDDKSCGSTRPDGDCQVAKKDGKPPALTCEEGVCVPSGCAAIECSQSFVCDAAIGACAVDCRFYGGALCPAMRSRCDDDTGLCLE
ncbi:MAG: hypothetical protein MUC50_20765 [Myxococcota bacterium]|nr:hypothetical protein [Myxococcota bacterium]